MKNRILTAIALTAGISGNAMAEEVTALNLNMDGVVSLNGVFVQGLVVQDGAVANTDGSWNMSDIELTGYGYINQITDNGGVDVPAFECEDSSGNLSESCYLSYTFGGLMLESVAPAVNVLTGQVVGQEISFNSDNSYVDFYLHEDANLYNQQVQATGQHYSLVNEALFGLGDQFIDLTVGMNEFTGYQMNDGTGSGNGSLEVDDQMIGDGWYFDLPGQDDVTYTSTLNAGTFSSDSILVRLGVDGFGNAINAALFTSAKAGSSTFATQVPEPSSLAIFSVALLGFGAAARRRRK